MADIHLHTPGGETLVETEERVTELLRSGALAPETLFWRSGMTDWEPVAKFVPTTRPLADTQPLAAVKTRSEEEAEAAAEEARTRVVPTKPRPEPAASRPATTEPAPRLTHAIGRHRFNFRRDPEPLTTIVQVILVICICVAALELANAVVRYNSLATETPAVLDADGNPVQAPDQNTPSQDNDQISSVSTDGSATLSPETETEGDDIGQFLEWIGWGANVVLIVPYFMWLYRTDQNCRNFSAIMRFKPEWAVWCYFVPPICFFRPCQVMQEIWRVSRNPRTWHNDRFSFLVAIWWLLTLGTVALAVLSLLHAVGAQTHVAKTNAELLFVGLKAVQLTWYGVFLAMVTLIIHHQMQVVREARRRGENDDEE